LNDECKQWPKLFFFTLVCYTNTCVSNLSLLTREKKMVRMNKCCHRRSVRFRLNEIFFSLFFFFFFPLCLFVVTLFFSMFCFFGISYIHFFFFLHFDCSNVSHIKRIKSLSWPPLLFCFSFIGILKLEHDMMWHKSRSTSKDMMFVHTSVLCKKRWQLNRAQSQSVC
jgi:hypothetical protein